MFINKILSKVIYKKFAFIFKNKNYLKMRNYLLINNVFNIL